MAQPPLLLTARTGSTPCWKKIILIYTLSLSLSLSHMCTQKHPQLSEAGGARGPQIVPSTGRKAGMRPGHSSSKCTNIFAAVASKDLMSLSMRNRNLHKQIQHRRGRKRASRASTVDIRLPSEADTEQSRTSIKSPSPSAGIASGSEGSITWG